jgi:hypothetical protein
MRRGLVFRPFTSGTERFYILGTVTKRTDVRFEVTEDVFSRFGAARTGS